MRTTVRLSDDLLAAAKAHAARTGRTLTALLEDAIRAHLALERRARPTRLPTLPAYGKGGVLPGVDLDNSADLLDLMDGRGAAR
jgi:Ribbon-helix-helix protein, copG family